MAMPEVSERLSHGAPSFFIREKRTLCNVRLTHGAHDDAEDTSERAELWVPLPPGVQDELVGAEPDRFFVPPYVGHRGWVGVRLDVEPDWDEVEQILLDAYRHVAPKTLVKELDA